MKNLWLFDERRLAILRELLRCRGGSARGCDLKGCLKVRKTLLSYHMGLLRDRGIVEEAKRGREKCYRIKPGKVRFVRRAVAFVG